MKQRPTHFFSLREVYTNAKTSIGRNTDKIALLEQLDALVCSEDIRILLRNVIAHKEIVLDSTTFVTTCHTLPCRHRIHEGNVVRQSVLHLLPITILYESF